MYRSQVHYHLVVLLPVNKARYNPSQEIIDTGMVAVSIVFYRTPHHYRHRRRYQYHHRHHHRVVEVGYEG